MKIILAKSGMLVIIAVGLFLFIAKEAWQPAYWCCSPAIAQEKGTSRVIFRVRCYDEGKAALQGMKGIHSIETGVHYLHETDTVYFDPKLITVEEMEAALKRAGTFIETIPKKERN